MIPLKIALFAILMSSLGCVRKQTNINLQVHVKTPEGEDISGAIVSLDREEIGETNAFGTLTYSFKAEQGSDHRVDVTKEAETYYFAAYSETKKIPKIASSEWRLEGIMYMVPKPRPTKSNLAAEIISDTDEKSQDNHSTELVPVAHRDSGLLNAFPFLDEDINSKSELDLSAVEGTFAALSDADPQFTVHTHMGHDPLANVEVYSCIAGKIPELLCKSNNRGRCVVRATGPTSTSVWSLIVKHPTSRTQIINGPFERSSNVRLSMVSGRSEDYLFVYDDIGPSHPAQSVAVAITGDSSILTSSSCGVISTVPHSVTSDARHVRATHDSIKGGIHELDLVVQATPFQDVALMPVKKSMPRLVVEPLVPGPNLTEEDYKRWFEASPLRRVNSEIVSSIKISGIEAIRLDEFQDLNRTTNKGVTVVERTIKAWNKNAIALGVATHRVRSILHRSGDPQSLSLSLSLQLFDAQGKSVFSARRAVLTANDISVVEKALIQNFVTAMNSNKTLENNAQIDPVGRWLIVPLGRDSATKQVEGGPIAVDGSHSVLIKAPKGHLNTVIKVSEDAIVTAVHDPITFEEDLVEKLYNESAQMTASQLLHVVLEIKKDHSQRRTLNLIAAYLESLIPDSNREHLLALAQDVDETGAVVRHINRSIALVMMADRESEPKDSRIKNASEAIKILDVSLGGKVASSGSATSSQRRVALFYRGRAKSILGELTSDSMTTMDAEADIREFMKRTDGESSLMPGEERLRTAAAKTLQSLDAQ